MLPNYSPHQKPLDEQKITSNGRNYITSVSKKLCSSSARAVRLGRRDHAQAELQPSPHTSQLNHTLYIAFPYQKVLSPFPFHNHTEIHLFLRRKFVGMHVFSLNISDDDRKTTTRTSCPCTFTQTIVAVGQTRTQRSVPGAIEHCSFTTWVDQVEGVGKCSEYTTGMR